MEQFARTGGSFRGDDSVFDGRPCDRAFCYPSTWNFYPDNIDIDHERLWDWRDTEISRCLKESIWAGRCRCACRAVDGTSSCVQGDSRRDIAASLRVLLVFFDLGVLEQGLGDRVEPVKQAMAMGFGDLEVEARLRAADPASG